MLGKLSVPGRTTSFDDSRARAYCACNRCGWGLIGHFSLNYLFSSFSVSLGDGPIQTEIVSQGPLSPKQPTNQQATEKLFRTSFVIILQRERQG